MPGPPVIPCTTPPPPSESALSSDLVRLVHNSLEIPRKQKPELSSASRGHFPGPHAMFLLTLLAGAIGTVIFAALFTHWLWYARVGGPKPIPGPPQLPVLGHVHLIMPHITNYLPLLHAWAVKYVYP